MKNSPIFPSNSYLSNLMKGSISIAKKVMQWFFILLLGFGIMSYSLFTTPIFQDYLLQQFTAQMAKEWNTNFSIREISFSPLSNLTLHDFHLVRLPLQILWILSVDMFVFVTLSLQIQK